MEIVDIQFSPLPFSATLPKMTAYGDEPHSTIAAIGSENWGSVDCDGREWGRGADGDIAVGRIRILD